MGKVLPFRRPARAFYDRQKAIEESDRENRLDQRALYFFSRVLIPFIAVALLICGLLVLFGATLATTT